MLETQLQVVDLFHRPRLCSQLQLIERNMYNDYAIVIIKHNYLSYDRHKHNVVFVNMQYIVVRNFLLLECLYDIIVTYPIVIGGGGGGGGLARRTSIYLPRVKIHDKICWITLRYWGGIVTSRLRSGAVCITFVQFYLLGDSRICSSAKKF